MIPMVYLASGWFNSAQKTQMDEIYTVLATRRAGGHIRLFAPFYGGIVLKKDDAGLRLKMKEVWELDIQKLRLSSLVVVSTQDHDVGSIFEAGYASACEIPILCYNSNPELGLNVMLSQEARGFCKSPNDLDTAIAVFAQAFCSGDKNWRYNLWKGEPL